MDSSAYKKRVTDSVKKIKFPLPAENLLFCIKDEMSKDSVMTALFGKKGNRIHVDKLPVYVANNLPLIEFYWNSETFPGSLDVLHSGTIEGRIVLPAKLVGDFNTMRKIALLFELWIQNQCSSIFRKIPELTEIGVPTTFQYNRILQAKDGFKVPFIPFTMGFLVDLQRWKNANDNIPLGEDLAADLLEEINTHIIKIKDDKNGDLNGAELTRSVSKV